VISTLAKELGVSATPLREALGGHRRRRLCTAGRSGMAGTHREPAVDGERSCGVPPRAAVVLRLDLDAAPVDDAVGPGRIDDEGQRARTIRALESILARSA